MIRRTMDATTLNMVANDPAVRPFIGGEGVLDLWPAIGDSDNITLETDHGGWLFMRLDPGSYELHTMFLPSGRGAHFFAAIKHAFRYLFTSTDAVEIVTKCPDDNPGARMAAVKVGFKERFRRENAWAPDVGISYQCLTLDDWAMRDPEALQRGRDFHAALEEAKKAAGSKLEVHPDDEAHDRAVGTALLIMGSGQTGKGVGFYNRWARLAGYGPIAMLGQNVVDIGDAVVELKGADMEILLCR